jgi:hypothetical protein
MRLASDGASDCMSRVEMLDHEATINPPCLNECFLKLIVCVIMSAARKTVNQSAVSIPPSAATPVLQIKIDTLQGVMLSRG